MFSRRNLAFCAPALMALWSATSLAAPALAQEDAHAETARLMAEIRKSFKLRGKPVPPQIFRDMGDGNLADSTSAWVTVDLDAAVGSNLYADDIREDHGWVVQRKAATKAGDGEETSYRYIGATANNLLVAVASYNGGGSGTFYTLHVLDLAPARAFDGDGKKYVRLDLTLLRSVALGDRWDGDVTIASNQIRIATRRGAGAPPSSILAERP